MDGGSDATFRIDVVVVGMKGNFQACLAITLSWEGGTANNPRDPGGLTSEGITHMTYDAYRASKGLPLQSVTHITQAEVDDIYKTRYWDVVHGDTLPAGLDMCLFDFAVNSGPTHALSTYMALLTNVHPPLGTADLVRSISANRLTFLKHLTTWSTFGKGWQNRVDNVEAEALKMLAITIVPPPIPPEVFSTPPVHEPTPPKGTHSMLSSIFGFIFARLNEKSTVAGIVSAFFAAIHFAAPAVLQADLTNAIIAVVGVIAALLPIP